MKIKKGKIGIYLLSSIAFISLISVGFSSWVLDKQQSDVSEKITAEIGDIVDSSITAEIIDAECKLDPIMFDADDSNGGVIINGDGEVKENLTFIIAFNVQSGFAMNANNVALNFAFDDVAKKYVEFLDGNTQYIDTSCLVDCEITLPTTDGTVTNTSGTISNLVTYSNSFTTAKIVSTFIFKWGSAFNNANPCASTDQSVIQTLKNFENVYDTNIGNNSGFTVTITPKEITSVWLRRILRKNT